MWRQKRYFSIPVTVDINIMLFCKLQSSDSEISPDNRNSLVEWLAHLTKKFKFLPETFELAVTTLDRLLQTVKVSSVSPNTFIVLIYYVCNRLF